MALDLCVSRQRHEGAISTGFGRQGTYPTPRPARAQAGRILDEILGLFKPNSKGGFVVREPILRKQIKFLEDAQGFGLEKRKKSFFFFEKEVVLCRLRSIESFSLSSLQLMQILRQDQHGQVCFQFFFVLFKSIQLVDLCLWISFSQDDQELFHTNLFWNNITRSCYCK